MKPTGAKSRKVSYGSFLNSAALMACVPTVPMTSVLPSAAALATWSLPIVPPAPARLSMITVWCNVLPSASATTRPTVSVVVPGPNGTIILIGAPSCAAATPAAATSQPATSVATRCLRMRIAVGVVVMSSPSSVSPPRP